MTVVCVPVLLVLGCSLSFLGPEPVQLWSGGDGTGAPHLTLTSTMFLQDLFSQYFPSICVSWLNTDLAHHSCLDRSSCFLGDFVVAAGVD